MYDAFAFEFEEPVPAMETAEETTWEAEDYSKGKRLILSFYQR